MNQTTHQRLSKRKRRIQRRLAQRRFRNQGQRILATRNIAYEVAGRVTAIAPGGIGAIHLMVQNIALPEIIDDHLQLLKIHAPYHESDHVLNIAYNVMVGGTCLQDMELIRNNEAYLDALGVECIPDCTTAGDFCRRYRTDEQVLLLMECFNEARLRVWKQQPSEFFKLAIVDVDGTIAPTTGECKKGMDLSYDGQWSYHPLLVSLANTKEILYLVNRPGSRPSHEQADEYLDKTVQLCQRAGFERVLLRGDTDFEQTWKLDGWNATGYVTFIFGADACKGLTRRAEALSPQDWRHLDRPAPYQVKTTERAKPENIKEQIIRIKGYKNFVLEWEDVAEFEYRPACCKQNYRMIALRKRIAVEQGQERLFEEYRYFFYITNDRELSAEDVVYSANDRCDQENLIAQLKGGVRAMRNPLDNLHSNWAYMVMTSLAWTLKAWCGLLLPVTPGAPAAEHQQQKRSILKMEFRSFMNALIQLPCQIVRTGRRILYRLLGWNPWAGALLRLAEAMRKPLRC